jgi:hypothetical protein
MLAGIPCAALTVSAAPDITVQLNGTLVTDDQVAIDNGAGGIAVQSFGGSLPTGVEVDGYFDDGVNGVLFSVDSAVSLPGGIDARPEDVVRLNGGTFSLAFDGSARGVPSGVKVDAVSREPGGNLVLSFDTTVVLSGITFEDEDLARFDGSAFTMALDGSAVGIDRALDVDGAAPGGPGVWALSFDSDGVLGGVTFADEDIVRVNTSGPTFALLYDGSAAHPEWGAADVHAMPEPGFAALLCGAATLAALAGARPSHSARRRMPCESLRD